MALTRIHAREKRRIQNNCPILDWVPTDYALAFHTHSTKLDRCWRVLERKMVLNSKMKDELRFLCPVHGDVSAAVRHYTRTGRLTSVVRGV